MRQVREHMDGASLAIVAITLGLFVTALFVKGVTHELFLEAGVFLVSVKLVMMAYKNSVATRAVTRELQEIRAMLSARSAHASAEVHAGRLEGRDDLLAGHELELLHGPGGDRGNERGA